jgi:hypothetical protein
MITAKQLFFDRLHCSQEACRIIPTGWGCLGWRKLTVLQSYAPLVCHRLTVLDVLTFGSNRQRLIDNRMRAVRRQTAQIDKWLMAANDALNSIHRSIPAFILVSPSGSVATVDPHLCDTAVRPDRLHCSISCANITITTQGYICARGRPAGHGASRQANRCSAAVRKKRKKNFKATVGALMMNNCNTFWPGVGGHSRLFVIDYRIFWRKNALLWGSFWGLCSCPLCAYDAQSKHMRQARAWILVIYCISFYYCL